MSSRTAVVLLAMPGINRKLRFAPSFSNRVVRTQLHRMNRQEMADMLEWRFIQAGGRIFPFDSPTLDALFEMSKGNPRTVCGIGRGDSAVRVTNGAPTTLATLRDSIHVIRELANGRSVAYKGKSSQGETAEWITIEPVAKAIEVLERLSFRVTSARGLKTLWPVLIARPACKDHLSAEIVRQLNRFRDHLNDLFGARDVPAVPNGPDDQPWRITTRQFRRTIA